MFTTTDNVTISQVIDPFHPIEPTEAPATAARNYDDVKKSIRDLVPFHHATCSGHFVPRGATGGFPHGDKNTTHKVAGLIDRIDDAARRGDVFVLASYGTPIAFIATDGATATTAAKFSNTTTRQINIFKAIWGTWK